MPWNYCNDKTGSFCSLPGMCDYIKYDIKEPTLAILTSTSNYTEIGKVQDPSAYHDDRERASKRLLT